MQKDRIGGGMRKSRKKQEQCAFSSFSDAKRVQQSTNSDSAAPLRVTPLISVYADLYPPQLWRSLQIQITYSFWLRF